MNQRLRASRMFPMLGAAALMAGVGCGQAPAVDAAGGPGGAPDDPSAYSATGALIVRRFGSVMLVCTGTAIAPRVVVSAAHCVRNISKWHMEFTLSPDASAAAPSVTAPVRRAFVNPGFDLRANPMHDIALVELGAPLGISTFEQLLPPAAASQSLRSGGDVELVGYAGESRRGATHSVITSIGAHEMTIGGRGLPQSCVGDSGGPAFVLEAGGGRRLAGIVSRSANDATTCVDGSVDTRVDAHADWISKTVATIESEARWPW